MTLAEARQRLARGDVGCEELVKEHLDRASLLASSGLFVTLTADQALADARRLDQARASGARLGPLHGVPITLKDLVWSRGVRTTSGSRIFADFVPDEDAPCFAALRAAGAVLLGKTNLHELAFGVTNVNPHFGTARNPWDSARITGGSSGGSAASLAAGVGLGSIGTDTGGSIRIPSALCGTVGLKPTYGTVSRKGVTPLSWTMDHVGPMARTVEDVAILFDVLTGRESASGLKELPKGPRRLVLGIHEAYFFENLEPEVESAVRAAIEVLMGMGMEVVSVDVPENALQSDCRNVIAFSEAASFHEESVRRRPAELGADTRELLRLGLMISATDYLAALRARRRIVRAFREVFRTIDVLATPATVSAAPRIGDEELDNGEMLRPGLMRMATPFNTIGFPAISLPCGFTGDGRPIGLQLAASPGREEVILQVAHAYERSQSWWKRRPVI